MADTHGMKKHLCPYLQTSAKAADNVEPGPKDPSSVMQQVADSQPVASFSEPVRQRLSLEPCESSKEYYFYWHLLNPLLEPLPKNAMQDPAFTIVSNEKAADLIISSLQFLCKRVVESSVRSEGIYPPDSFVHFDTQNMEEIQRDLGYTPRAFPMFWDDRNLRFIGRIAQAIALRLVLETAVRVAGTGKRSRRSIVDVIVRKITGTAPDGQQQTDEPALDARSRFDLQIMLQSSFIENWNPREKVSLGSVESGALHFWDCLTRANERDSIGWLKFGTDISIAYHGISRLNMLQNWMQFLERQDPFETHLFSFPTLLRPQETYVYFRAFNHQIMTAACAEADVSARVIMTLSSELDHFREVGNNDERAKHLEAAYLLITVSRTNVLRDAMDQLWHRRDQELRKPLRVRLGEIDMIEVGHDLGGVQIEFFNLICKTVMSEDAGMFTSDPATGLSWFRPGSLQPLHLYELFGLLVGLAVYNGIAIPVSFPKALYYFLQNEVAPPLDLLDDHWPMQARSLRSLQGGDVDGLDYSFPLEANGLRLNVTNFTKCSNGRASMEVEDISATDDSKGGTIATATPEANDNGVFQLGWPGWDIKPSSEPSKPISTKNITAFTRNYTDWLTRGSTWPQLTVFRTGFERLIPLPPRSLFHPTGLKRTLEGNLTLDIHALQAATKYEGYTPSDPYILNFWAIVASWSQAEQRQLVKFVTALERIPAGGASNIRFEIKRAELFGHGGGVALPTSSTCFGTLNLPEYEGEGVLEGKLRAAVSYGVEGFGIS